MVGFIIIALFLIALIIFVAYSYWKPGAGQERPSGSPEMGEGQHW